MSQAAKHLKIRSRWPCGSRVRVKNDALYPIIEYYSSRATSNNSTRAVFEGYYRMFKSTTLECKPHHFVQKGINLFSFLYKPNSMRGQCVPPNWTCDQAPCTVSVSHARRFVAV